MVSVAGCLGYDVLDTINLKLDETFYVSVAGCLGYDVLVFAMSIKTIFTMFQLLVV